MSWERRPIADVADFCLGKMLDQRKNKGDLLPYLANVNVRWGEFDLDDLREMRFEQHEMNRFGLRDGDIVMCEGGEPGRCAIWKDQMPGMMFQKALHRIRPKEQTNSEFLFYSLLHKGKSGHFAPLFTGATIKHLPREKLALIEVDVPPRPVQDRIADILSTYDDLIENNRRRMALLEEAARQLYREWFVRLRFPGHEHTRIIDGVPEGWSVQPIAEQVSGIFDGPHATPPVAEEGGVFLGIKNISESGRLDLSAIRCISENDLPKWTKRVKPRAGDIVFSYEATLHRYALIPPGFHGCLGRRLALIRPDPEKNNGNFLFQSLLGERWKSTMEENVISGATVDRVPLKKLPDFPLLIPPERLMRTFEEFARDIHTQLQNLTGQVEQLRAARDHLLPRLMNGEIAV